MSRSNIEEGTKYMVSGAWIRMVEDFMENLTYNGRPLRSNGPGADIAPSPFERPPVVCVPTCACAESDPVWREKECDNYYHVYHYVADVYDNGTSGAAPVTKVLSSFMELILDAPVLASYHLMAAKNGGPVHKLVALGAPVTPDGTLAKITGAPTAGVYPVALYANGIDGESTGSGTAAPLNLSIHETIPTNTWIVVTSRAYTEVAG